MTWTDRPATYSPALTDADLFSPPHAATADNLPGLPAVIVLCGHLDHVQGVSSPVLAVTGRDGFRLSASGCSGRVRVRPENGPG